MGQSKLLRTIPINKFTYIINEIKASLKTQLADPAVDISKDDIDTATIVVAPIMRDKIYIFETPNHREKVVRMDSWNKYIDSLPKETLNIIAVYRNVPLQKNITRCVALGL
jgi:hypothetical protein